MTCCCGGKLKLISGPSIEPLTLAETLEHCHANSGVEDNWFYRTIAAGRREAEIFQRRAYISQQWQLTFNGIPQMPFEIPRPPTISIDSISTFDIDDIETSLSTSDFLVDTDSEPARLTVNYNYTIPDYVARTIKSFVITFTAGYGTSRDDVPDDVKYAILEFVSYYYDHRAGELSYRYNTRIESKTREPKQFYDILAKQRIHLC